jgi:hypothetical protein
MRAAVVASVLLVASVIGVSAGAQRSGARGAPTSATARGSATPDTGLVMGSFVSSRIDGKRLPVTDLATDSAGVQYVIEFAELVLALKANGEFRAALRYRQTLAAKGQRTTREPLQRMVVFGSWYREGQSIRFVPDPKRGGEGLRILVGTATSRTITVPFDYRNGRLVKRSTALLVYDPSIL